MEHESNTFISQETTNTITPVTSRRGGSVSSAKSSRDDAPISPISHEGMDSSLLPISPGQYRKFSVTASVASSASGDGGTGGSGGGGGGGELGSGIGFGTERRFGRRNDRLLSLSEFAWNTEGWEQFGGVGDGDGDRAHESNNQNNLKEEDESSPSLREDGSDRPTQRQRNTQSLRKVDLTSATTTGRNGSRVNVGEKHRRVPVLGNHNINSRSFRSPLAPTATSFVFPPPTSPSPFIQRNGSRQSSCALSPSFPDSQVFPPTPPFFPGVLSRRPTTCSDLGASSPISDEAAGVRDSLTPSPAAEQDICRTLLHHNEEQSEENSKLWSFDSAGHLVGELGQYDIAEEILRLQTADARQAVDHGKVSRTTATVVSPRTTLPPSPPASLSPSHIATTTSGTHQLGSFTDSQSLAPHPDSNHDSFDQGRESPASPFIFKVGPKLSLTPEWNYFASPPTSAIATSDHAWRLDRQLSSPSTSSAVQSPILSPFEQGTYNAARHTFVQQALTTLSMSSGGNNYHGGDLNSTVLESTRKALMDHFDRAMVSVNPLAVLYGLSGETVHDGEQMNGIRHSSSSIVDENSSISPASSSLNLKESSRGSGQDSLSFHSCRPPLTRSDSVFDQSVSASDVNRVDLGSDESFDVSMGGGPSANNRKLDLYKTELCRSWEEKGICRYGSKCQFAHGGHELREVARHPKFKSEVCRTFWLRGSCPYGRRCCFIHTTTPADGFVLSPSNSNTRVISSGMTSSASNSSLYKSASAELTGGNGSTQKEPASRLSQRMSAASQQQQQLQQQQINQLQQVQAHTQVPVPSQTYRALAPTATVQTNHHHDRLLELEQKQQQHHQQQQQQQYSNDGWQGEKGGMFPLTSSSAVNAHRHVHSGLHGDGLGAGFNTSTKTMMMLDHLKSTSVHRLDRFGNKRPSVPAIYAEPPRSRLERLAKLSQGGGSLIGTDGATCGLRLGTGIDDGRGRPGVRTSGNSGADAVGGEGTGDSLSSDRSSSSKSSSPCSISSHDPTSPGTRGLSHSSPESTLSPYTPPDLTCAGQEWLTGGRGGQGKGGGRGGGSCGERFGSSEDALEWNEEYGKDDKENYNEEEDEEGNESDIEVVDLSGRRFGGEEFDHVFQHHHQYHPSSSAHKEQLQEEASLQRQDSDSRHHHRYYLQQQEQQQRQRQTQSHPKAHCKTMFYGNAAGNSPNDQGTSTVGEMLGAFSLGRR